jgi:hypothetical protein
MIRLGEIKNKIKIDQFCTSLKNRKQEMMQNKSNEEKINKNLNSSPLDLEMILIEKLDFNKNIYYIYFFFLGSIFLYGIKDFFIKPLNSKESTDGYFMCINSLNCLNCFMVNKKNKKIINNKFISFIK